MTGDEALIQLTHARDSDWLLSASNGLAGAELSQWVLRVSAVEGTWSSQAFAGFALVFHRTMYEAGPVFALPWQRLLERAVGFRGRIGPGPLATVLGILRSALEDATAWNETDRGRFAQLVGRGLLLDPIVQDSALASLELARAAFGATWTEQSSWHELVAAAEQVARRELTELDG